MTASLPLWELPVMIFGWITFFLNVTVTILAICRRKQFSAVQMCFVNVVILNSIAELSLFLHIELSMRARRYRLLRYYSTIPPAWLAKLFVLLSLLLRSCTFLGFITLAINRFTAIYCPVKYRKIWSLKHAICACILNWTIAAVITVPVMNVGEQSASFYVSALDTLEIKYVSTDGMVLGNTAIALCFFAVVVCSCLYGLVGYIILKAKLLKKGIYIGTVEMKYLICALLTFLPLIFELVRSIIETYYNPVADNSPKMAKQLWTMSHELLLGVQFCTLVYAARLHRLILNHPIWNWRTAEVQSSQPESWTVKRHFQCIKLYKFGVLETVGKEGVNDLKANYSSVITDDVYKMFKLDNVQFQNYQALSDDNRQTKVCRCEQLLRPAQPICSGASNFSFRPYRVSECANGLSLLEGHDISFVRDCCEEACDMNQTSLLLYELPIIMFSWISFFLYVAVFVLAVRRRQQFKGVQMCFLNVVALNSISDLLLFLQIEFTMRSRSFLRASLLHAEAQSWLAELLSALTLLFRTTTLLGFITLAVNRYTAVYHPLSYTRIWSGKNAVFACVLNWAIATITNTAAMTLSDHSISLYVSQWNTLEIKFDRSHNKIVGGTAAAFTLFTAVVCASLYGLVGYSILKAKLMKQGTLLGKVELKYLVCTLLTFVPLLLEVARATIDRITSSADVTSGENPTLARKLWMVSHELLLGVQFSALVFGTRLYRLIIDHPFWNRTHAVHPTTLT